MGQALLFEDTQSVPTKSCKINKR